VFAKQVAHFFALVRARVIYDNPRLALFFAGACWQPGYQLGGEDFEFGGAGALANVRYECRVVRTNRAE